MLPFNHPPIPSLFYNKNEIPFFFLYFSLIIFLFYYIFTAFENKKTPPFYGAEFPEI